MVKNLPAKAGDVGLIPDIGRTSGEGNGSPQQYSCLGNPMDRGAWWATVHRAQRLDTPEGLNNNKEMQNRLLLSPAPPACSWAPYGPS